MGNTWSFDSTETDNEIPDTNFKKVVRKKQTRARKSSKAKSRKNRRGREKEEQQEEEEE